MTRGGRTSQTFPLVPLARAAGAALQEAAVAWPQRMFDSNRVSRMGPLRRHCPVAPVGPRFLVVTRHADVLEVLDDAEAFDTPYGPRLPGRFVLGLSGEEHRRQRAEIGAALSLKSPAALGDRAAELANEAVERATRAGRMDVGTDLVHPVLARIVADYLGVRAPDDQVLLRWARDLFDNIFLNPADLPQVGARAAVAAAQMTEQVAELVAAAGPAQDEQVLGRLLQTRQLRSAAGPGDAHEIHGELIGVAIGWLWHGAKAAVIAVDELLDRPEALACARRAARDGDRAGLRRVLMEVFRFRPVQVGLVRVCRRDTVVAGGTDHAREVRAGTSVLAGTHSAMWDEEWVPDPGRFDPTRTADQYLVFGHGPHRCMGEDIMGAQLPALLAPLLRVGGLRRSPGPSGRLRWVGPHPDGFAVELGA